MVDDDGDVIPVVRALANFVGWIQEGTFTPLQNSWHKHGERDYQVLAPVPLFMPRFPGQISRQRFQEARSLDLQRYSIQPL
jgi:hypothetical protein